MSLAATRNPIAVRFSRSEILSEALFEEGFEWKHGSLADIFVCQRRFPEQIEEEDFQSICDMNPEEFEEWRQEKSWGAVWMARRLRKESPPGEGETTFPSLARLRSDLAAYREISQWLKQNAHLVEGLDITAEALLFYVNLRFAWEVERFIELYAVSAIKERSWASCYQISHLKVKQIALCPNFRKLPLWVKAAMARSNAQIPCEGRVGNIWRYIDCAKAWKYSPSLPKNLAERVGKMSPKARMLSGLAFWLTGGEKPEFWIELKRLLGLSLVEVLELAIDSEVDWGRRKYQRLINLYLGLPYNHELPLGKKVLMEDCLEAISKNGSPQQVVCNLFGVGGKATIAAFQNSRNADARQWAMFLAKGKADLLQKYFALENCIPFEKESLPFLQTLGDSPALRMISTTTYKVQGKEKPVENYLIRDTGYLWNQIKEKPHLRRVRCWLSVHEKLAYRFLDEQPEEELPIHPQWEPVNGLSAVDKTWRIILPKSTSDLKLWGILLHHCVGAYGPAIKSGRSIILAVELKGAIAYTVEMCPSGQFWECNQFLGLKNCQAPKELSNSVLGALPRGVTKGARK